MKRILAACSFAALLVSSACAEGAFVGAEGGWFYKHGKFDESNAAGFSDNASSADLGLKLGYIITDDHRVYGAYHYDFGGKFNDGNGDIKGQFHKFLLGYDFTPQIYNEWRGILGVYGGYTFAKLKPDGDNSVTFKKGFAYGAKVGALYEINANNEVEFGVKAEQLRYNKKQEVKPTITDAGLYVGYAYKF